MRREGTPQTPGRSVHEPITRPDPAPSAKAEGKRSTPFPPRKPSALAPHRKDPNLSGTPCPPVDPITDSEAQRRWAVQRAMEHIAGPLPYEPGQPHNPDLGHAVCILQRSVEYCADVARREEWY